jgi:hypothetical protein
MLCKGAGSGLGRLDIRAHRCRSARTEVCNSDTVGLFNDRGHGYRRVRFRSVLPEAHIGARSAFGRHWVAKKPHTRYVCSWCPGCSTVWVGRVRIASVSSQHGSGPPSRTLISRLHSSAGSRKASGLTISLRTTQRPLLPAYFGRKSFLFVGAERAGHAAAIYYSLVESCKANKVNPLTYLT